MDGDKWHQKIVNGPSGRGFSAVTFRKKRKAVILHGGRGRDRATHSDTWEWDGHVWNQLHSENNFPADHHQMVYLPNDEKILAFGGWDGKGVSGQAWVWNGQWEKVDVVGPRQRASFGMAYDIEADKAILFGGKA